MAELKIDCVRDMLLFLESSQRYKAKGQIIRVRMRSVYSHLDSYSYEDRYEAAKFLGEKGLVQYEGGIKDKAPSQYWCIGITAKGHDFIQAVKSDTIWKKVKSNLPKLINNIDKIIQLASVLTLN
jgi:hypothetical protein